MPKMEPRWRWSLDDKVEDMEKRKSTELERKFRLQILEMHHQNSYTKLTVTRFPMFLCVFLVVANVSVKPEL